MKKCYLIIFSLTLAASLQLRAQVQINDSLTVDTLVNSFFNSGVLVSISNITFNGTAPDVPNNQIALFTGGATDSLGMDEGMAMATRAVMHSILGTGEMMPNNPQMGDPDVQILAGFNTTTCAVLEFDVLVEADALAFNYVFASTEYASFTCTSFNDAFGFFISGPGIEGTFSNNAINIATIPGTDTPIAINTVNGGAPTGAGNAANCLAANPNFEQDTIYFVQNLSNAASSIAMNGYTVNMEAYVEVQFGETYHMKLALCNAVDQALQSAVFFESGSFEGRLLGVNTNDARKNQLKVYPNPTRDILYIANASSSAQGDLRISVSDLQGREVLHRRTATAERIEIPVEQLPHGIYIVNMYDSQGMVGVSKFVKN